MNISISNVNSIVTALQFGEVLDNGPTTVVRIEDTVMTVIPALNVIQVGRPGFGFWGHFQNVQSAISFAFSLSEL